jgi:hypothetical protein
VAASTVSRQQQDYEKETRSLCPLAKGIDPLSISLSLFIAYFVCLYINWHVTRAMRGFLLFKIA